MTPTRGEKLRMKVFNDRVAEGIYESEREASDAKLLATGFGWEFWHIGPNVFRSSADTVKDAYGLPADRRWECNYEHWVRFRAIYEWVTDVA